MVKLKRPVAFVGGVFVVTLAVVQTLGIRWVIAGVCALAIGAVLLYRNKLKDKMFLVVMAIGVMLVAVVLWAVDNNTADKTIAAYSGAEAVVTGYVTETEQYDNSVLVTARLTDVQGGRYSGFEVNFFTNETLVPGDGFSASVRFKEGQSPYANHLSMQLYIQEMIGIDSAAHPLLHAAYTARQYVISRIRYWLPGDEGAVAATVITGDKTQLPTALRLTFNRAGVSHILVVSGLHITLIISLLFALIQRLRLGRIVQLILLLVIIAACILFYGPRPSVLRACIMSALLYSGGILLRRSDAVTSLAVAAVIILFIRPTAILEASFLLSFGCCVALTVVYPALQKILDERFEQRGGAGRVLGKLLKTLALPATISAVTFPLLVLFGMPVSLVSPLTNLLDVPLVPVLIVLSFFACIPVTFIGGLASLAAGLIVKIILAVSEFFASLPFSSVETTAGYLKIFLVYSIAVAAVVLLFPKQKVRKGLIVLCMILVLLTGAVSQWFFKLDKAEIVLYSDEIVLLHDKDKTLVVIQQADQHSVAYLAEYCNRRFSDSEFYVIIVQNVGAETERQIVSMIPGIYRTMYSPHLSGIAYDEGYIVKIDVGRFYVLVYPDGGILARLSQSQVCVLSDLLQMAEQDGDLTISLRRDGIAEYYVISNGHSSKVYGMKERIYIYGDDNGIFKVVV